jgi:hypothetical protein
MIAAWLAAALRQNNAQLTSVTTLMKRVDASLGAVGFESSQLSTLAGANLDHVKSCGDCWGEGDQNQIINEYRLLE